jgi:hypothetical protein
MVRNICPQTLPLREHISFHVGDRKEIYSFLHGKGLS